ncbi:MAG: polysaccharide deacetylase family protein [Asgard group archaeon]|nr:polysaccharide deacetylase family protein [Asgard group archaeon]
MPRSKRSSSWFKHLKKRRGSSIIRQTIRMSRYHRQPFHKLLSRIFETLEEYDANFTFPLVAHIAKIHQKKKNLDILTSSPYEIAIHGYKHIRYEFLTTEQMKQELQIATETFKELKIPYKGFRAPYNNYSEDTKRLLEEFDFEWDIGIGYRPEYQETFQFFNHQLDDGKKTTYACVPLNKLSDDYMIEQLKMNADQMATALIEQLEKAKEINGVVMFDLHPIRLGRKEYISSLKLLLEHGQKINAWFPSVTEAIDYWKKHKKWKDNAPVCCLLTGDIDNFTFWDYLRRF